jgi:pimeloyl-ACP methyl ester carboxylesterase
MRNVALFPGTEGSTLWRVTNGVPDYQYWLRVQPLINGNFKFLKLNSTADGPADPNAGDIKALGLVKFAGYSYDAIVNFLRQNYNVVVFPYDWRKPNAVSALDLYNRVNAVFGNTEVTLLGHSMGCIMARRLYRLFKVNGKDSQIRRVISLGGPHWGAPQGVATFGRLTQTYRLASWAAAVNKRKIAEVVLLGATGLAEVFSEGPNTNAVDDVMLSWPSLYELMPIWSPSGPFKDVYYLTPYQAANWKNSQPKISQMWLDAARNTQNDLLDDTTWPPQAKRVDVAGVGYHTPIALRVGGAYDKESGYVYSTGGDGTVGVNTAFLEQGWGALVIADHLGLTNQPNVLLQIPGWIENGLVAPNTDPIPPTLPVAPSATVVIEDKPAPPPGPLYQFPIPAVADTFPDKKPAFCP